MCGLVGVAGNLFQKHENTMRTLLFLDTLRGSHSTGLARINNKLDIDVYKRAIPGSEFIDEPRLRTMMAFSDRVWLGHNRYATIGSINRSNAHPFVVEDEDIPVLVGAHNGTLKNKHALKDHNQFNTDSEALFNSIYHEGVEETISSVEGAWALSWWDGIDDKLNFLRNKERPLFFGLSEDEQSMVWASEEWMISVASSRSDLKIPKVYYFDPDKLYTFTIPPAGQKITYKVKEGVSGKEPAFFQVGYTYHPPRLPAIKETKETTGETTGGASTTTPPTKNLTTGESGTGDKTGEGKNVVPFRADSVYRVLDAKGKPIHSHRGFNGKPVTEDYVNDIKHFGCRWCSDHLYKEDAYAWLDETKMVCTGCVTDSHDILIQEGVKKIISKSVH